MEDKPGEGIEVVLVLHACANTAPEPWYPSVQGATLPIARPVLDAILDELRLAGLVQLTDWVAGRGQGYTLTAAGNAAMHGPPVPLQMHQPGPEHTQQRLAGNNLRDDQLSTWQRGEEVREALLSPAIPKVTNLLIVLNLIVFGYGLLLAVENNVPLHAFFVGMGQGVENIIHETGGITRPDIEPGQQWWRLLSACFVHFGLLHLGVNMYSLYAVGPLLERMWGRWRYLVLYLLTGIGGSSAMVMFTDDRPRPFLGGGASGALWGLMASMAAWVVLNRSFLPKDLYRTWMRQLGIVFLLNVVITYSIPGLSAAAHFGGGAVGLVLAFPLEHIRHGKGWQRLLSGLALVAVLPAAVLLVAASFSDQETGTSLTPQEEGVRRKFVVPLWLADELASKLYQQQAHNILHQDKALVQEDKTLRQAIKEFRAAEGELNGLAGQLAQAGPFPPGRLRKAVEAAQEYLERNAAFFGTLARALEQPQTWTPPKRQELKETWRQGQELRRQWSRSPLFQAKP